MAVQMGAEKLEANFEYELLEGDPDHLRTVVANPNPIGPWIDPSALKFKHRIGRGNFGDVWLATHHQSGNDYDEYHEVAVKVLHLLKEDHTQKFLYKYEGLHFKLRGLGSVCWLHGVSVINGKVCLVMKFYEGSVGDRVARLKGGKLDVPNVIRYGINMAKGILEVHSVGLLALNLKPTNFLLNEHNEVIIGDFGIPYLLLGTVLANSEMTLRLGTPNYMAPEQWEPAVRGPVSFETDAWGFGCSILEILTGIQPWFGKSIREIYKSVVVKQERPHIPSGLPPAVDNVITGCFEYDLRNRPSIADILYAFQSSQNAVYSDGEWLGLGSMAITERLNSCGYTTWYFSKDHINVGDTVRTRKPRYYNKTQTTNMPEGTVCALEKETDRDSFVRVMFPGVESPLKVQVSTIERVTHGMAMGDWVCLKEESDKHSHVGLLHCIERDGSVAVGFVGLETLWRGDYSQLKVCESYYVGQFVKVKANIASPRIGWPQKSEETWATGRISQILPNGCLLVKFPGRLVFGDESKAFLADPAEVELVSFDTCTGVIEKYQHIEDFHWTVRPLAIAFSVFTAMKVGLVIGRQVRTRLKKGQKRRDSSNNPDGQAGGTAWLPSPVANILFKEGASVSPAR